MSVGASKLQKEQFRPHKGRFFWLLRAPHWMTSRVLEMSGMKTPSGWDWSFRTYSEVRWTSELDSYLREGKIKNVQHLFASGQLSPFCRAQGSGRSLLHYAICLDRNNQMVDFLLEQGVDPSIEGGLSTSKTPLRLVLEIGRQAASNKLYPLLPYLRCLLRHSQDLVYGNADEAVKGTLSEFHGTSEEFRFLQQHCCPIFYRMPRWARIKVAAQIICDSNHSRYADEANNTPDLIRTVLSKDTLEVQTFQTKFTLPLTPKETTLMHCIAEKLGTTQGFLQMSCRWEIVAYCRYQRFSRPASILCRSRWQAIYESWKSLFFDILPVEGDIHQIVDGKTLLIAFLDGYLASLVSLPESNQALWLGQEIFHVGIRAWLKDMRTAGLNLEELGAHEWRIWKSGKVQMEFNGGVHRLIGIVYGPCPEDWYIWLLEPSDSFVGEFWALVERPAETMPGEWPGE
ncbi:hypothetical protein BDV24DRAFT_137067 [Aspergillus arachidicola]|uniref:Ankyrin repeat-containing domain protein n=1 Tax=Aspergillus arachidicola TaxID=656916 RepID=A0A5N6Y259_9EURO|nr:hypothetical protein BDV24DRAFT_137067 [Aspergillus arachidicola]